MPRLDVVCLGEALVDFLPDARGRKVRDVTQWTPCLGGAPANVAVGLSRLGARSALVGVTGDDEFGHFLKQGLAREGVNVSHLRQTTEGKTGLGFVSLTATGERSFTFYRVRAAETFLSPADTEAARSLLKSTAVLHVGTNSLIHAPARAAVTAAVRTALESGQITSTDPNLRLHLWKDPRVLQRLVRWLASRCAVMKLSDEEIEFVTGSRDPQTALEWLEGKGVLVPIVTCGAKGAFLRFKGETRHVPAHRVKVVDTTGAGDGFVAGFLSSLTKRFPTRAALESADLEALLDSARQGCLVGSRVVTKLGAVRGLPTSRELRSATAKVSARP